jgi:hypothetical protein
VGTGLGCTVGNTLLGAKLGRRLGFFVAKLGWIVGETTGKTRGGKRPRDVTGAWRTSRCERGAKVGGGTYSGPKDKAASFDAEISNRTQRFVSTHRPLLGTEFWKTKPLNEISWLAKLLKARTIPDGSTIISFALVASDIRMFPKSSPRTLLTIPKEYEVAATFASRIVPPPANVLIIPAAFTTRTLPFKESAINKEPVLSRKHAFGKERRTLEEVANFPSPPNPRPAPATVLITPSRLIARIFPAALSATYRTPSVVNHIPTGSFKYAEVAWPPSPAEKETRWVPPA